jgi:hypothetical protein
MRKPQHCSTTGPSGHGRISSRLPASGGPGWFWQGVGLVRHGQGPSGAVGRLNAVLVEGSRWLRRRQQTRAMSWSKESPDC